MKHEHHMTHGHSAMAADPCAMITHTRHELVCE